MPLFTAPQLSAFIQYEVPDRAAKAAEQVVSGWLLDATELDEWPTPLPPQLYSWAVELGVMAHENPGGLRSRAQGGETDEWQITRRDEILTAARAWAQRQLSSSSATSPVGCFPPAQRWPDPADRPRRSRW